MEVILEEFKNAVQGFAYLVNLDWKSFQGTMDTRMIDGLENGMVQKFEYTIATGKSKTRPIRASLGH